MVIGDSLLAICIGHLTLCINDVDIVFFGLGSSLLGVPPFNAERRKTFNSMQTSHLFL